VAIKKDAVHRVEYLHTYMPFTCYIFVAVTAMTPVPTKPIDELLQKGKEHEALMNYDKAVRPVYATYQN
jgi:hypothetical protein